MRIDSSLLSGVDVEDICSDNSNNDAAAGDGSSDSSDDSSDESYYGDNASSSSFYSADPLPAASPPPANRLSLHVPIIRETSIELHANRLQVWLAHICPLK